MLLLLILVAWLAVVILVVAVCQAAARGESARVSGEAESPETIREGLVVWDEATARALRAGAPARRTPLPARRHLRGRMRARDQAGPISTRGSR